MLRPQVTELKKDAIRWKSFLTDAKLVMSLVAHTRISIDILPLSGLDHVHLCFGMLPRHCRHPLFDLEGRLRVGLFLRIDGYHQFLVQPQDADMPRI